MSRVSKRQITRILTDRERGGDMYSRNSYMAKKINETLEPEDEAMGIFIGGKNHLARIYFLPDRGEFAPAIQELIKPNIKPFSVNIVVDGEEGISLPDSLPQSFAFLPGDSSPVFSPRPKLPPKFYMFGDAPYASFIITGRRTVPEESEWLEGTRPFYWNDTDGVLFYNPD